MTEAAHTADRIRRAIACRRFRFTSELELQAGIEQALTEDGIEFEREARLGDAGVIDFLAGDVGIEVKTGSSTAGVIRQLLRYAERYEVGHLVLVTTKPGHSVANGYLRGIPVDVHLVDRGAL